MLIRARRRRMVGVVATTAAVAGTAHVVNRSLNNRDQRKQQEQYDQQQSYDDQQEIADLQDQVAQLQAQQTTQAAAPAPAAAAPAEDPLAEIKRLGELKEAGLLTDEEFSAAKAKLLGI